MILETVSKKTNKNESEFIEVISTDLLSIYNIQKQDFVYRDHFLYFQSIEEKEEYFDFFTRENVEVEEGLKIKLKYAPKRKLVTKEGRIMILIFSMFNNLQKKFDKKIKQVYDTYFITISLNFGSYVVTIKYDWELNMFGETIIPNEDKTVFNVPLEMEEYEVIKKELSKTIRNFRYYNL